MSYIDKYQQIARQGGFQFYDNQEKMRPLGFDNGNMVRVKFALLKKDDIVYYAYDMYAHKAYMKEVYSGFYTEIDPKYSNLQCKITKKNQPCC